MLHLILINVFYRNILSETVNKKDQEKVRWLKVAFIEVVVNDFLVRAGNYESKVLLADFDFALPFLTPKLANKIVPCVDFDSLELSRQKVNQNLLAIVLKSNRNKLVNKWEEEIFGKGLLSWSSSKEYIRSFYTEFLKAQSAHIPPDKALVLQKKFLNLVVEYYPNLALDFYNDFVPDLDSKLISILKKKCKGHQNHRLL